MLGRFSGLLCAGVFLFAYDFESAQAAEGAASFYLLGSKNAQAGIIPPPGVYVQNDDYYYTGDASGSGAFEIGDVTVQSGFEVEADTYYKLLTPLVVTPLTVLGGNVGFGIAIPVGWKDVSAAGNLQAPQMGISQTFRDEETNFGDPVVSALVGWHRGNWHWNVGALVNIPIGKWEEGALANIGFNRWGLDLNAAVTWLDPQIGLDLSAAAGFTFHAENPDTEYQSGNEFHLELAAVKSFSQQFSAGVVGYYYEQISGDSGGPPVLGAFKGRVAAIGPFVSYNFKLGETPISTRLRWYHEFDAKNRLEGDAGFFSLLVPVQ
jgi:hypothetical protein